MGRFRLLALASTTSVAAALAGPVTAVPVRAETAATAASRDPLASVMWDVLRTELFGAAPVVFDDRVTVVTPDNAEDAGAVPILADATALGRVEEMVLFADLNPFPLILRYRPMAARPLIATRFKVQQATPVRAAARTPDGVWHVGGKLMDAAGGGCTAAPATYASPDWSSHLGEVQARAWPTQGDNAATGKAAEMARVRFRVRHPMDTGLANGIPAFYIETLSLRGPDGRELGRIEPKEPVSENPVFTLEVVPPAGSHDLTLDGRDIQGDEIKATIPLPWTPGVGQ